MNTDQMCTILDQYAKGQRSYIEMASYLWSYTRLDTDVGPIWPTDTRVSHRTTLRDELMDRAAE